MSEQALLTTLVPSDKHRNQRPPPRYREQSRWPAALRRGPGSRRTLRAVHVLCASGLAISCEPDVLRHRRYVTGESVSAGGCVCVWTSIRTGTHSSSVTSREECSFRRSSSRKYRKYWTSLFFRTSGLRYRARGTFLPAPLANSKTYSSRNHRRVSDADFLTSACGWDHIFKNVVSLLLLYCSRLHRLKRVCEDLINKEEKRADDRSVITRSSSPHLIDHDSLSRFARFSYLRGVFYCFLV